MYQSSNRIDDVRSLRRCRPLVSHFNNRSGRTDPGQTDTRPVHVPFPAFRYGSSQHNTNPIHLWLRRHSVDPQCVEMILAHEPAAYSAHLSSNARSSVSRIGEMHAITQRYVFIPTDQPTSVVSHAPRQWPVSDATSARDESAENYHRPAQGGREFVHQVTHAPIISTWRNRTPSGKRTFSTGHFFLTTVCGETCLFWIVLDRPIFMGSE